MTSRGVYRRLYLIAHLLLVRGGLWDILLRLAHSRSGGSRPSTVLHSCGQKNLERAVLNTGQGKRGCGTITSLLCHVSALSLKAGFLGKLTDIDHSDVVKTPVCVGESLYNKNLAGPRTWALILEHRLRKGRSTLVPIVAVHIDMYLTCPYGIADGFGCIAVDTSRLLIYQVLNSNRLHTIRRVAQPEAIVSSKASMGVFTITKFGTVSEIIFILLVVPAILLSTGLYRDGHSDACCRTTYRNQYPPEEASQVLRPCVLGFVLGPRYICLFTKVVGSCTN